MSTLLKPIHVRQELLDRKIRFFTPAIFSRLFQISAHQTKYFLERQTEERFLLRLKQGLYTLLSDRPADEEIANALYKPSYISFEYALAYYSIIPERPYTVTSATTKSTTRFTVQDRVFAYHTIKKKAYTGYHLVQKPDKSFLIAEPEKAVVDYVYFSILGKSAVSERLQSRNLEKKKLLEYATMYDRISLLRVINTI